MRAPTIRITQAPLAGANERMGGVWRAVEEVPSAQPPLLAFNEQQTFAAQNKEVLLIRLAVVHGAGLARLEDVELEADLRVLLYVELRPLLYEAAVGLKAAARAEDVVAHPRRVADVEHEPAIALRDEPCARVGQACFLRPPPPYSDAAPPHGTVDRRSNGLRGHATVRSLKNEALPLER